MKTEEAEIQEIEPIVEPSEEHVIIIDTSSRRAVPEDVITD